VHSFIQHSAVNVEEIMGDRECGLRRNKLTTYNIFCIRQEDEKKWENSEAGHQLL
jgi:hypothetical protein